MVTILFVSLNFVAKYGRVLFDTIYFYVTANLLSLGSYDFNEEEPLCARVVTNFLEVSTHLFFDFDDIASDISWFTSIDVSDPDQLMLLTCSVQGIVQTLAISLLKRHVN